MTDVQLLNRANADYLDWLYQQYQADPKQVEPRWRDYFDHLDSEISPTVTPGELPSDVTLPSAVKIADLVHAYRDLGHFVANLDPLGSDRSRLPLLELSEFGLSEEDLDRPVSHSGFLGPFEGTLRDLIAKLRQTYCDTLGVEYIFISDKAQRQWLTQHMEPILNHPPYTPQQSRQIFDQIVSAQGFEEFLGLKYPGQKRFSLEGGESLIPMLNAIVDGASELGVDEMVLGMAHRGRLNVLAHVLQKPYELILSEFEGRLIQSDHGDGDVKYHLGYSVDRTTEFGRKIHLSLSFNPSHLELVNPVVEGIVRAKQNYMGDHAERRRVVPVLIHGDAAFTGQGIVQETLNLSEMPYYRTGGTIHIIINNQIGFTTFPRQGRFTPYATDVAKMIQAPIFHVNGDDPEAVVHAAKLAIAFRQQFHTDVLIDLWCYRRHGHNEADDPSFTQPVMYRQIADKPAPREIYAKKLLDQNKITQAEIDRMKSTLKQRLEDALKTAKENPPKQSVQTLTGAWRNMTRATSDWSAKTQVPADLLQRVGQATSQIPQGFTIHPKLKKLYANRQEMAAGNMPADWGTAEMLALGSLLLQGTAIRFVGQDAQRGTFSHRHAVLRDYNTGDKYVPLDHLDPNQAPIIFVNTMLSELAVLGFEYGFSSADPNNLVVWEAQFGDFVNGAQAIIDQFIVAAESKWQRMSGLVMLLPHGFEGQGPEHSHGYLERFLQLCANNNIQVCVPSLPSQYFHLLRRQVLRNFRKPLVLMMPKSLLRLEQSTSPISQFTEETFQLVLDDPANPPRERVRRLLLCSGKIYFSLNAIREKHKIDDVAIVRVEQLYPFPQKELQAILGRYRQAQEVLWVQEEPRNRGGWTFIHERLEPLLPETAVLRYCGREESASPATGSYRVHQQQEEELLSQALELSRQKARLGAPATLKQAAEKATPVSD